MQHNANDARMREDDGLLYDSDYLDLVRLQAFEKSRKKSQSSWKNK